jgi:uncharacterized coiled-coil DUF342 family protein
VETQTSQLSSLHRNKEAAANEIKSLETALQGAHSDLTNLMVMQDEKTKLLESAKRVAIKASKETDRVSKEISGMVRFVSGTFTASDHGHVER